MKKFTSQEIKEFVSKPQFGDGVVLKKDLSWPKISIVTPSYNQGQFLERTILSVLNQNYPNLEYIIIDGGSSDNSVEIIKKYEKYLGYWVSEKDDGQADALKKGFAIASGDILAWLNSDDFYLDNTFKKVANVFKTSDADVVYGDEYLIDKDDAIIGERRQFPFPKSLGSAFLIYGGFGIYQPASFWSRKLYRKVGGINPSYNFAMDTDLFIRFALEKPHFEYLKGHVVCFRFHDSSKSCTIRHIGLKEKNNQIKQYGSKVYKIFRNRFLMRNLGRFYLLWQIRNCNGLYLLHRYARRLGLIKKHPLIP